MKKIQFKLTPNHIDVSDKQLLDDLKAICKKFGVQTITMRDYDKFGKFHSGTISKRFGGWNNAIEKANLKIKKRFNIPKADLIKDLRKVAEEIKPKKLTQRTYDKKGKFTVVTIQKRIGWNNALKELNIEPSLRFDISEEELFNNLKEVWLKIGKTPGKRDMIKPNSKFSETPYRNRFGSWRSALEAFVEYVNTDSETIESSTDIPETIDSNEIANSKPSLKHKTKRDPNWRLRFKVLQRDNFSCKACGRSPAKVPTIELHVDHILPWSKGGETIIENLQTLCSVCNLGKGNFTE